MIWSGNVSTLKREEGRMSTCKECKHCDPNGNDELTGICRINPPVVVFDTQGGAYNTCFPTPYLTGRCGKWESDE